MFFKMPAGISQGRNLTLAILLPDIPFLHHFCSWVSLLKQLSAVRKSSTLMHYIGPEDAQNDLGQVISLPHIQLSKLDFYFYFQSFTTYLISAVSTATILREFKLL